MLKKKKKKKENIVNIQAGEMQYKFPKQSHETSLHIIANICNYQCKQITIKTINNKMKLYTIILITM